MQVLPRLGHVQVPCQQRDDTSSPLVVAPAWLPPLPPPAACLRPTPCPRASKPWAWRFPAAPPAQPSFRRPTSTAKATHPIPGHVWSFPRPAHPCHCHVLRINPDILKGCVDTAEALINLMEKNIRARDIMTKEARRWVCRMRAPPPSAAAS